MPISNPSTEVPWLGSKGTRSTKYFTVKCVFIFFYQQLRVWVDLMSIHWQPKLAHSPVSERKGWWTHAHLPTYKTAA